VKNSQFFKQAELLLKILPIVNRESVFALKGGTAINFFVRNLPRLSVDIDLVYLPIKERSESLQEISKSILSIEGNILKLIPGTRCQRKIINGSIIGLIINTESANVKIEPNTVIRGAVYKPVQYDLCSKGKELFEMSVKVRSLVSYELYAGKICAALDRQHPRDLFDIKLLFENEGITDQTRKAFIVYLISHNRPIAELLKPNFIEIATIYEQEFVGMTNEQVSLEELGIARERLVLEINKSLTDSEKEFLISFKSLEPKWDLLGMPDIENLPAVNWKLLNLKKMESGKREEAVSNLRKILFG
jgi:predicted nucleotidyltransferase component of viral defense system